MPERNYTTRTAEETRALAARLAETMPPGTVILLIGELGAGKTCFAQGLARACGIRRPVASPTFTLINEYNGEKRPFAHMDLYRIGSEEEAFNIGIEDYLYHYDGITAIEWPDRAAALLPTHAWRITLTHDNTTANPNTRQIHVVSPITPPTHPKPYPPPLPLAPAAPAATSANAANSRSV